MLQFETYSRGALAKDVDLSGAYVFGLDQIPVRADIAVSGGILSCIKRVPGACGLAILWEAGKAGRLLLPTTRMPERQEPYNLNVELARAQMTRLTQKREDWGLFDYANAEEINREYREVRAMFVESLKPRDQAAAAAAADEALARSVMLGEKMALFHADVLLERRKANSSSAWRTGFGCMVDLLATTEEYARRIYDTFDFISIPSAWKHIEPKEGQLRFAQIDHWINWAARTRKFIHAGPLLSFDQAHLPEWVYIWEHDYESLRDLIYEHIQRMVSRYASQPSVWKVVSGIHAYNSFNLSFEQLMELTRMSCLLVKKLAPRSRVMIDLVMPWGEYYARNQRTIPPLLYADMAVQSGIKFDAFGVQIHMGVPVDGLFVRDLMQISSMLDEFAGMGKTVHITACQVPSAISADAWDAWGGREAVPKAGVWHAPWSQRLQAEWLRAFYRICMSKPFIESICWHDLADYEGHYVPHGGLCKNNMEAKLAFKELRNFKTSLHEPTRRGKPTEPTGDNDA